MLRAIRAGVIRATVIGGAGSALALTTVLVGAAFLYAIVSGVANLDARKPRGREPLV